MTCSCSPSEAKIIKHAGRGFRQVLNVSQNGAPIDLSGFAAITASFVSGRSTLALEIGTGVTIIDAPNGQVAFDLTADQVAAYAIGTVVTFSFTFWDTSNAPFGNDKVSMTVVGG